MTEQAFERQVAAMTQEMYRVAASLLRNEHDRQDAVQECIWKGWKNLPRLRDETLFRAWLMRILINECKSIGRRAAREVVMAETADQAACGDAYAQRLRDEALHSAVMALPPKLRLAVTLYYMDGFSLRETARALRVPEGTVKSRLDQARKKLKSSLEGEV